MPARIASRTRFHKVCLGAENKTIDGRTYMSWGSLNKLVGHNGTVDLLKLDIEGWEYEAIPWIVGEADAPVEIAMEVHSGMLFVQNLTYLRCTIKQMKSFQQRLDFFRSMYVAGYYILSVTGNPHWRGAAEYSFARLHCANRIVVPPSSSSKLLSNSSRSSVVQKIVKIRKKYMSDIKDVCRTRFCEENRESFFLN